MSSAQLAQNRYHTSRVVHLAVVAALGGFLFGFDTAVINGAVNAVSPSSRWARRSPVSPCRRRCSAAWEARSPAGWRIAAAASG